MFNFKPVLALVTILAGFLISLSVAFVDKLGPDIPLAKKNISEILKTSYKSSITSIKEHKVAKSTRKLAKLYLSQKNQVQRYSNLSFNKNLSDPDRGKVTFFTVLCYGNSKDDCIYLNTYLRSSDYGESWKIGFLE